jgi:ribosomal protein L18E
MTHDREIQLTKLIDELEMSLREHEVAVKTAAKALFEITRSTPIANIREIAQEALYTCQIVQKYQSRNKAKKEGN